MEIAANVGDMAKIDDTESEVLKNVTVIVWWSPA